MEAGDKPEREQAAGLSGAFLPALRNLRYEVVHQLLRYLPQVADF